MGIKFNCPNGHKIHVKAFLAGKRGICPQCGVKVDIPTADASSGVASQVASVSNEAMETLATGVAVRAVPAVSSGAAVVGNVKSAEPAVAAVGAAPAVPPLPSVSPGVILADPIAEAPQANWWVRPRSGGQFGPAGGAVMRQWIAENRVAADSLVWREGWPQWKPAVDVFPDFSVAIPALSVPPLAASIVGASGQVAFGGSHGAAWSSTPPHVPLQPEDAYTRFRRRRRQRAIAMIVVLAIAAAALVGLLIWQWATR